MTTHRDNCPRCILDELLRKATTDPKDRARRFSNITGILGYTPEHSAAAHALDDEIEEIIDLLGPTHL
jgi:hypothetical protein